MLPNKSKIQHSELRSREHRHFNDMTIAWSTYLQHQNHRLLIALPPLPNSPESNANPLQSLTRRAEAEAERQRLLGVFGSLSSNDLRRRLERYASLLSPHLGIEGFRQMVRDLPKPVLVRTLVDVVQSAPSYTKQ